MRSALVLIAAVSAVSAQTCSPAGRLLPNGSVSGALDAASCSLTDGTPYTTYRLDLPVRGRQRIDLDPTATDVALILRDAGGRRVTGGASLDLPLEAGSYTVLVNGARRGFSLRSSFQPEPGMLCTNFPLMGLNQTVNGTLGAYGCVAPDGTAYDAYRLTTLGAGNLTVAAISGDFSPVVTVRDADGHALLSAPGVATVPVDGDSRISIVVASSDQRGSYQLATTFVPDEMETCRARKTLSDSGSDAAVINPDSCTAAIEGSGDLAYYNFYELNVGTPGVADIGVSSRDFESTLYLLDESGNTLAVDSGGGGFGQSRLRMQLAPGHYTVQVFSAIPSGGEYTLTYGFQAGAPQRCAVTDLSVGDAPAGSLSPSSCRTAAGLADLYRLTLSAAGTLDLSMTSAELNARIAVRDAKENVLIENDDSGGGIDSRLVTDLQAGTYLVTAGATSGAGGYRLSSGFTPHEVPPCSQVQQLAVNGGFIQRLSTGGCRAVNGQPADWYEFTLPADAAVAAVMTSSQVDGFLTLTDPSGRILRADDNGYVGGDPLIIQYLSAGTYRLEARAASSTNGGLYRVDLLASPGARPPFCGEKGVLGISAIVSGSLTYTACQYPDATFADLYRIELAADTVAEVRLNSAEFDAYLILLDSKGNVLEEDDNAGGGNNARMVRPLAAGTYFVAAKAIGDYTAGGAYTLSISQISQ